MRPAGRTRLGGYPLSATVRRVRRAADLSQRQLAKATGLSVAMVGAIETGERTPSLSALQRILGTAGFHDATSSAG